MAELFDLRTEEGLHFRGGSSVIIGSAIYDIASLNDKQKQFVIGRLNEQALRAAFAGHYAVNAEGIPTFEEAFGSQ